MADADVKTEQDEGTVNVKSEVKSEIPDDVELKRVTLKILGEAKLEEITKKTVRRSLEGALGLGDGALDDKKTEINAWIDEFMAAQEQSEEEEAEEEEEEEKPTKGKHAAKKKGGGFSAALYLKPNLAEFMGKDSCARTEVVKEIWRHAKENNLQDPKDKRWIICDDRLTALFNKKKIHMFKMNKDLSKFFGEKAGTEKADEEDEDGDEDGDGDEDDPKRNTGKRKGEAKSAPKGKKAKGNGGGGFQAPVRLSEDLQALLGADSLPRTEVVKQLWAYIKSNELQNPAKKSEIIPANDQKMKAVFGKTPFTGFQMMTLLKPHLTKME